jgi:Autographiviridae terminase large subunit
LEPVLNTHRLVVDQNLVEIDLKLDSKSYFLFYQLSSITRKPTLKHDDRLDVFTRTVEFWTNDLKRDEEQAKADYETQDLDKVIEWLDSLHLEYGQPDKQWVGSPIR